MDKQEKNIVGVYDTEQEAVAAIEDLIRQGYRKDEISVIGKSTEDVNSITEETGTAAEDTAATGALAGGAIGGVTGFLAGIGALAIPGIGPFIAAGPIAATLLGGITGAGLGGLTGALIGLGIPEDEAEHYGRSVEEGKILVLVKKRDYLAGDGVVRNSVVDDTNSLDNRNDRNSVVDDTNSLDNRNDRNYLSNRNEVNEVEPEIPIEQETGSTKDDARFETIKERNPAFSNKYI
ncbi:general stress protein [Neobacillus soli]|uniref:general stress protein n=1 Tax=Neobacillus soli TaxID=220688 RepID=UPI000A044C14|nr:general stress protein [Neobacillus soli]